MNYVILCIGPVPSALSATLMQRLVKRLTNEALSIQTIQTMGKGRCIVLTADHAKGIHPLLLTKRLGALTEDTQVDVAVLDAHSYRLPKRLLVLDMDSTLVQSEGIDELAKEAGVGDRVVAITHRAMNGEIAFPEALRERVRLLKGLPAEVLERVHQRTMLTPGARTLIVTLQHLGVKIAVLSGGFDYFTSRLKETLSLDYAFSNQLEIKRGRLTGEVIGEIVDGKRKLTLMEEIVQKERIPFTQVIAIGDGANDLPMITRAGIGIAFNAKPAVREAAPYNITQKSLDVALYFIGIGGLEKEDLISAAVPSSE